MIDKILNNIKSSTEIPTSGLSYKLQAYLGDIYDTYNCPKEIVISAALNAAGVAAGKKITTYDGKFTNNLSLWYCAVAPSGSGKTEPLDIIFKPLQEIKKANYKAYRKELAQWNKQAKAQGKSPEGEQPRYDRILLNNSTAEARHNCLQAAEQGLCLFVDELRAFLSNLSRYGSGNDIPELLTIWNAKYLSIERKSEEPREIQAPFLSIVGGLQTDLLPETFGSKEMLVSGFNARWIFTYQEDDLFPEITDKRLAAATLPFWKETIDRIYNLPQTILHINGTTKELYTDFCNSYKDTYPNEDSYIKTILKKFFVIAQRLAGILHILNEEPGNVITEKTMQSAIDLMRYYETQHRKVWERLNGTSIKEMSEADLIRQVFATWPMSQGAFARLIGRSQQYISKVLKPKEGKIKVVR